ncbi:MAG: AI-2E family transporter [Phycisphaerae bacterium]
MNAAPEKYDLDRVVRLVVLLAVLAGLFLLVRTLADVLLPFAIAVLLAYLLNPIVTLLERRLHSRTLAAMLTVFTTLLLLVGAVLVLTPVVQSEIGRFESVVGQLRDSGSALARRARDTLAHPTDPRLAWLQARVNEFLASEDFATLLKQAGALAVPTAWGLVSGALRVVAIAVGLTIVLVYLVFLLIDYRLLARRWKEFLPPAHRGTIVEFFEEFRSAMARYFRGQFVVATLTGALFATGFSIIHLPLAVLVGLLVGLMNMVPYLQTIAIVPCCILGLLRAVEAQSSPIMAVLAVLAVFAVVQCLMDGLLAPRIVGHAVGLRPALIMLSIFVWGRLLGFLGLVLAIPLTCLALAYYRRVVLKAPGGSSPPQPGSP